MPKVLPIDWSWTTPTLLDSTRELLEGVDELPSTVESNSDVSAIAPVVVKLRDLSARSESHRKAEKEPHLRTAEAVDAFFFRRMKEPLDAKRKELSARLDVYKQRQLFEERQRREAEAAAARKAQAEAQRLREEAEAAARRARSAETQEQRKAEAVQARAEAAMAEAQRRGGNAGHDGQIEQLGEPAFRGHRAFRSGHDAQDSGRVHRRCRQARP